jgi:hypothetical protein
MIFSNQLLCGFDPGQSGNSDSGLQWKRCQVLVLQADMEDMHMNARSGGVQR